MRGLFISGSHTNIGKTTIAKSLVKVLRINYTVKVRKPVETGSSNDAITLLNACSNNEDLAVVCPYRFKKVASAEVASSGKLTSSQLINACKNQISDNDFAIIEGAGGLCSPIAKNTLNIDIIKELALPMVLVIKDELGAVNQALLTIKTARQYQINIAFLVLNQFSENSAKLDNKSAIEKYSKIPVYLFSKDRQSFIPTLKIYNL